MELRTLSTIVLPGMIMPFAGAIDPETYLLASGAAGNLSFAPTIRNNTGWILCDGSLFLPSVFHELGHVIGGAYGSQDGQFRVPDYRGWFLRGQVIETAFGATLPPETMPANEDRSLPEGSVGAIGNTGSRQQNMVQEHAHPALENMGAAVAEQGSPIQATQPGNTGDDIVGLSGSETRPINTYVHYLIYAGNRRH